MWSNATKQTTTSKIGKLIWRLQFKSVFVVYMTRNYVIGYIIVIKEVQQDVVNKIVTI